MGKLIEFLETVFLYILYPNPEERGRQFELRKIWRELRYLKLVYTDIHGKKIFSIYASKLFSLFKLICSLRKSLQLPWRRQELLQEADLLEYLVLQQLEPQTRRQLNSFTYDFILDRISHAPDQNAAWKSVQREWTEFSRQVSELHNKKLADDLFQVELLYALMEFDFESLLKLFDPGFIKNNIQQVPKFSDVQTDLVDQYLLDFYFIIARFRINANVRNVLDNLYMYYHEESEEHKEAVRESLDYIELLFENELSENTLRSLIQLIHQDPEFEPETAVNTHDYIAEVHLRLTNRFESSRDRVKRDLTDISLKGRIQDLLSEHSLLDLYGYNYKNEEVFHELGLSGFLFILPLQVVKTYYQYVFTKGILGSLRKIHDDGYYESPEFQKGFGEAIRKFPEVNRRIEYFETQLENANGVSIDSIIEMARTKGNSIKNFDVIKKYVDSSNKDAAKMLQFAGRSVEDLHRRIGALLGDYRASNPKFISNIRVLGGDRNRDIILKVEQAYYELDNLLKILSSYTVVSEISINEQKKEKTA